ncbi:MAG TPA: hypothetical protein VGD62_02200, partial [Acidobacteriaceae bacterium]
MRRQLLALPFIALLTALPHPVWAQSAPAALPMHVAAVGSGQTWLLSAGEMSYAVGVNDAQMLQTLYWGPRLREDATLEAALPKARMQPELASFDPPIATTPLEYPGWSGG